MSTLLKAFCINLKRRSDRWEHVQKECADMPFTLQRIVAVDGQGKNFDNLSAHMPRKGPVGPLQNGAVACSLSHHLCWQTFAEDQGAGEVALILEDDAVFTPRASRAIGYILDSNLCGYDLVKIESIRRTSSGVLLCSPEKIGADFHNFRSAKLIGGTGAYFIRRSLAQWLVENVYNHAVPIDHFLFYPAHRRGFLGKPYGVLSPAIVSQQERFKSDVPTGRSVSAFAPRTRGFYEFSQVRVTLSSLLFRGARLHKVPLDEG